MESLIVNAGFAESLQVEAEITDGDCLQKSYLRLWAAKMLIHVKDYTDGVAWRQYASTNGLSASLRIDDYSTADRWFNDDWDGIGSFIWVCDLFQLNPQRTLQRIKDRQVEMNEADLVRMASKADTAVRLRKKKASRRKVKNG